MIQLYREIFLLHLDFENLPQISDRLILAERQQRDFLAGIISRRKKRKTLDMIPVKVCEGDDDLVLFVAHGAEVFAEISQAGPCVNYRDAVRIAERDLEAGCVTAKLLKSRIANGNGTARAVEF